MSEPPRLLLYLASAADPARTAVGPALAAAAVRAGWRFECYYDAPRKGRHFGGGDPAAARPGWPNGSLVAGGRHADHLRWLARHFAISALGDPGALLWPVLDELGADSLARSTDAGELYGAAFERLRQELPRRALVVNASPQGTHGVVVAPYLYPAFFTDEPALGLDAGNTGALNVDDRVDLFTDVGDRDYAEVTAELAERHSAWARGVLLGDPDLVAAQLGRAVSLRLVPLYGRPQTDVITRAGRVLTAAREPVYGRQYDDHDFVELARHGRGLQVVDPGPPFEAARGLGVPLSLADRDEPDDAQLERWAREGHVLSTLLLWCGMVRELDCLPRLIDLVAETGLRAGLVTTTELVALAGDSALFLLGVPPERGGVQGLLEPLLSSTGHGVAAEALLPEGALADSLREAREAFPVDGWWPLLDTQLDPVRAPRVAWRSRGPTLLFEPRAGGGEPAAETRRPDLRGLAGAAVRASPLERLFQPRPSSHRQPSDEPIEECLGSVKWYNAGKGFGFIGLDDGGRDVFVHVTTLERGGLSGLAEGQRVRMKIAQGQKGQEVRSIEPLD